MFIGRSGQHQVEQAAAVGTALAVRSDHAVHDCVDSLARSHESGEARRPHVHQPLRRRQHHQKIVKAHDAVDGAGEFGHFVARSVANKVRATTFSVRCIMSIAMSRCSPAPAAAHAAASSTIVPAYSEMRWR